MGSMNSQDKDFWFRMEIYTAYEKFSRSDKDVEVDTTIRTNKFFSSVYKIFLKKTRGKTVNLVAKNKDSGAFEPYDKVTLSRKYMIDRIVSTHAVLTYHSELAELFKGIVSTDNINTRWQVEEFYRIRDRNLLTLKPFLYGDDIMHITVPFETFGICELQLDFNILVRSDVIRYCLARFLSETPLLGKPSMQRDIKKECDKFYQNVAVMAKNIKNELSDMMNQPESCESLVLSMLYEKGEIDISSLDFYMLAGQSQFTPDDVKLAVFNLDLDGVIEKDGNIIRRKNAED